MQPPSCQGLLLLLWAGVAHSALRNRRTPGESCSDVPSWKDSEGYNCSQYQTGRWCTAEGNLGTGWQARWNVMETYWHDGYTAISACCACGGGQVSHINGLWQVIRGPCTIVDECILSPNYPGNYSDNERCTIVVNSTLAKPLKTIHWDVEYWFDYLHINGNFYSGRNDPQGVVPAGSIQWRADEDTHGTGWKLCATDEAMTSTTAAGVAEVTEAATTSEPSTSSATSPEPAAPAEPIPCRDVEGWADLSDYSCAEYVQRGWCTSTGGKGSNWADAWGEFDDYWRNGYTAPQACCACGGGQVRSVVGAWQVLHGACTIVDNCIQSPNYPANYSSNGRCAIVTNSSFMAPLQLVDFATERFYDILTINNMQFSGLRKPSGVTPRGTIAWKSDEDIEAKGWKLCLGPKPSPPAGGGIFSVLEGPCTMDAGCAFSPNYPSHYGSLQGCIIQVYNPENKTIAAKDFVTEASYDVLWVNGRRYSGSSGPDGVVPRGPIQWSPDEDVEDKGWKLCPGPVGQPESEGPGAAEQGFYGDFGYGEDEDGAQSVTEPGTGLEQGSSGVAEDSTSEKPLEEEEVEVNGTLPFGKILLATAALCLTGVLCLRCRRNQDKGPGGFSTSYGRSYALDNL